MKRIQTLGDFIRCRKMLCEAVETVVAELEEIEGEGEEPEGEEFREYGRVGSM